MLKGKFLVLEEVRIATPGQDTIHCKGQLLTEVTQRMIDTGQVQRIDEAVKVDVKEELLTEVSSEVEVEIAPKVEVKEETPKKKKSKK